MDAAKEFLSDLDLISPPKVIFSPLLKIEAEGVPKESEAVVFSSRNGVKFSTNGKGRDAYCVGLKTAELAEKRGFQVQVVAETATELISIMVSNPSHKPVTHLRGEHARGDICSSLNRANILCEEQIIYSQKAVDLTPEAKMLLRSKTAVVAPIFSPRTAKLLSEQLATLDLPQGQLGYIQPIALSSEVARALLPSLREKTIVPPRPTRDMMIKSVERIYRL